MKKRFVFYANISALLLAVFTMLISCNKQLLPLTSQNQNNNLQNQNHDNFLLNGQGLTLEAAYLNPNPSSFFTAYNNSVNWGNGFYYDPTNITMSANSITLLSRKLDTPVTTTDASGNVVTYNYSTGVMSSHGLMSIMHASAHQPHGYLEMVASLPIGAYTAGSWPAFWLMPETPGYNWPYGMEIDIMECYGVYYPSQPVTSTIHFSKINAGTDEPIHASNGNGGNALLSQLHSYGLEWNVVPNQVTLNFYFDRNLYSTIVLSANSSNAQIVDGYNNYMASYNNNGWNIIFDNYVNNPSWNSNYVNSQTSLPLTFQINALNEYTVD